MYWEDEKFYILKFPLIKLGLKQRKCIGKWENEMIVSEVSEYVAEERSYSVTCLAWALISSLIGMQYGGILIMLGGAQYDGVLIQFQDWILIT